MSDAMALGLSGIQQGLSKFNQAATSLTQGVGGEGAESNAGLATVPVSAQPAAETNADASSDFGNGNNSGAGGSGGLAENVVALKGAERQVEASAAVVSSAEQTLGTLVDVEV